MKILLSFLFIFPCFGASMNFEFHKPLIDDPKGIIFFAHGLNTKASGYETLYQNLKEEGYQVFAPVLPGHDEYKNFGRVPRMKRLISLWKMRLNLLKKKTFH